MFNPKLLDRQVSLKNKLLLIQTWMDFKEFLCKIKPDASFKKFIFRGGWMLQNNEMQMCKVSYNAKPEKPKPTFSLIFLKQTLSERASLQLQLACLINYGRSCAIRNAACNTKPGIIYWKLNLKNSINWPGRREG